MAKQSGKNKNKGELLFNPLKRRVFRKRIPFIETLFCLVFLLAVVAVSIWVMQQKDNYDPGERDISFAALVADSVVDDLYHRPVKIWREPGQGGYDTQLDLMIFPKELLDGGWTLDGRVEEYNPENLYMKINGAADQYIAFDFRKMHYVTLKQGDRYLSVEVYNQGEFRNAMGVFAAQRDPGTTVGKSGEVFYFETTVGAIGIAGPNYFKITGSDDGVQIKNKSQQLVGMIGQMIADNGEAENSEGGESGSGESGGGGQMPYGFTVLAKYLDIDFSDVSYKKNDVFQYEFASDFWFGAIESTDSGRYYIHQAKNNTAADELYERLLSEQKMEYKLVDQGEDYVVFVHEYLSTYFTMQKRGAAVFGLDGLADSEMAEQLMDELSEVIASE